LLKSIDDILSNSSIHFIRQREPKGLGDAIMLAEKHIGSEPFVVALGDDIVISEEPAARQVINSFNKHNASIIGVEEVPENLISSYGVVGGNKIDDSTFQIKNLIEKPALQQAPSNMGIIGRYVLTPDIFDCLKATNPGHKGEIQLTDALKILLTKQNMFAYKIKGKRYDIGNKLGFLKATIELALQREDLKDDVRNYLKQIL
jgi:UTP--glucose-1-phosphate uridylyltransferase